MSLIKRPTAASLTHARAKNFRVVALLLSASVISSHAYAETGTTVQLSPGKNVADLWPVDASTQAARAKFIEARAALAKGNVKAFDKLKASLTQYTLYPFLEFEGLRHHFKTEEPTKASVQKLNQFEKQFKNDRLTRMLTRTLQVRFAETEQWGLFLGVSKSRVASNMPCSRLRAEYEFGRVKGFTDEALKLWIQPKKHLKRCQTVLDKIQAKHTPPIKAIWERIYLAMDEDKPKYAEQMLPYLSTLQRKQVANWIKAIDKPLAFLESGAVKQDSQLNRRRFADVVLAWSKTDPVAAMNHWLAQNKRYRFYKDRYYDTHRLLAMRGAYRRLPEAHEWLQSVPARSDDLELKEWRIRTALFAQDWPAVLAGIARLPAEEQEEDHWAYWVARAHEELGEADKAKPIYTRLATLQSYHGFLSADQINTEYAIRYEALPKDPQRVEELATQDDFVRAREFHHTGIDWESRRAWNAALENADDATLAAATVLARHWNMPVRALFTAGRVEEYRRAIDVRFPMLFEELVTMHSSKQALDPSLVYGLMRRESAFTADARSAVGATGLMQIMPKTAKHIASMKGLKNWHGDLTDPSTNIEFGSFYFRHVLDRFDEREVLAAAAYNAGPHRVLDWLPEEPMAADVWIDAIPYSETRRYVRALLAYI